MSTFGPANLSRTGGPRLADALKAARDEYVDRLSALPEPCVLKAGQCRLSMRNRSKRTRTIDADKIPRRFSPPPSRANQR